MCVIHDVLSVPKKGNILRMKRVSQQQINENGKPTTKPLMKNVLRKNKLLNHKS